MSASEFNENVLNANENQENLAPESASAFDDAMSILEAETAAVESDSFFGRQIITRGKCAIELAGHWSDDLLDRETIMMRAPKKEWGAKTKWRGLGGWIPVPTTWRGLIETFEWPTISPEKNGSMIVFGEIAPEPGETTIARHKKNVKRVNAVPFDLDAGQPEDEIFPRLLEAGYNFIYYTSHSNGKTRTKIDLKALREFVKLPVGTAYSPALDDVKGYLAEELKLHPTIVESASIVKVDTIDGFDNKPSKDPLQVEIAHAPIHKCRIILPLANEYVIPDDPDEALAAMNDFKAIVDHLAGELGFWFDSTSGQVGRAFYAARCKSYANYRAVIGGSTPLVLPACTDEMRVAAGFKNQELRKKALAERQARRGDKQLDGVPDTTTFMRRHADDFDGIGWLKDIGWEVRSTATGDKAVICCPNEKQHSDYPNPSDAACVAINPGSQYKNGEFLITCQHAHCRHFETRDFLTMICEEVIESTVGSDLPALENFVTVEAEVGASACDGATPNGRLTYAKLKKLLGTKSAFAVNKFGYIEFADSDDDDKAENAKKKKKAEDVCKAFEVLDMARDEEGGDWALRIEFLDFDDRRHIFSIPLGELNRQNSDVYVSLGRAGFEILNPGLFKKLLKRLKPRERTLVAHKPGWRPNRKVFICPDGTAIGNVNGEAVWLEEHFTNQRAGTLEGQLKAWELAFKYGGTHHLIGCLAGVAGVLVQFSRLDSSPIIAFSGNSSHGKTTSMSLAAGCWGWPKILKDDKSRGGLLHTLRSTVNAAEFYAERATGTVLALDESKQFKDEKRFEELVFMLAEGSGKLRMSSEIKARRMMSWNTIVLLSSEIPIAKIIENAGGKTRVGYTARIADLNMSDYRSMSVDHYDELKRLRDANYGWIGPAFVKHLIESGTSPDEIGDAIHDKVKELIGDDKSPLVSRAAGVFGLLWVTGELLGEAGLLPDLGGGADGMGAARIRKTWETYKQSEVAKVLDPVADAVQTLRQALVTRRDVDVYSIDNKMDRMKNRAAVAYYKPLFDPVLVEDDGEPKALPPNEFYVLKDEFQKLAGGVVDGNEIVKALDAGGILKRPAKKKTLHCQYVPRVGGDSDEGARL